MLRYALGGIVLSASMHSAALSLGGHMGQAVIGRALDMQVRSNATLAELEAAACLEAEVSYGDMTVPPQAVSLQLQQAAEGVVIRVRSNEPVNEPVVSVLVRAGCSGQVFSRRYVLLADLDASHVPAVAGPPQVPLVTAAPAAPALPVAPQTQAVPSPTTGPVASLPPVPRAAPSAPTPPRQVARPAANPAPAPRAAAPRPAATPGPAPTPMAAAPTPPAPTPVAPAPSGPRLQLDPVNLAPQGAPTLKSTTELQSLPTESDERRRSAQALWAALNAPPEQQIQDTQKLATLEQEVQGLRAEEQKLKASIETLQRELQQAREERTPGWLVGLLVAALLLMLGALIWLLRERRRAGVSAAVDAQPWWQSSQGAGAEEGPGRALSEMAQAESGWSSPVTHAHGHVGGGVEVSEATESSFVALHEEVPADVDTLVDLNQHCEFFDSLGQRADAVAVLEDFVGRHPSASELPYLWLLRLSEEQGRDDERLRWSRRYEQVFGRAAPAPEAYDRSSQGLLGQDRLLGDLQALWPTARAQELLRQAAFGRPGVGPMSQPTLAAYQEVLLLHTLAQVLLAEPAPPVPTPVPASAGSSEAWPSVAVAPVAFQVEKPLAEEPRPLDLDLGLDLTLPDAAPPPPPPDNAPPSAEPERRELPMLDFDLFELEPKPGNGEGSDEKG